MKIVHVITGLEIGGAEMSLCRLLESKAGLRGSHAVIALGAESALSERVRSSAPLLHLGLRPSSPNPLGLLRLRHVLRAERADLVHAWMYHANLAATIAAGKRPVPVVWSIRQCLYDIRREKRKTRAVIWAGARLSGTPQAIVYNARLSATQHERLGYRSHKNHLIPNGFDTLEFRPDRDRRAEFRAELGVCDETLVIGLVARWHPMKDHETFLRAASLFAKENRDVVFAMIGDAVEMSNPTIRRRVQELELDDAVRLLGRRNDVNAIASGLDIVCSASAWGEAFPNIIGEAMACGVPCVATDVGDVRDIIGHTGIIIPPRDPDALSQAWRSLASLGPEGRRALGERARARIVDRYSIGEVSRQYVQLYAQITADVKGP